MILSLNDVSFTYGSRQILDHVNFVVNENEKWGVVGRNGAGKSTLLKLLAQNELPDTGEVNALKKYTVSYCPQDSDFPAGKTVYDTVRSYMKEETEVYQIRSILNKLGVEHQDEDIGILSGGQKKRVSLAITLIKQADLYLLDEPTNHLDQEGILWLEKYLCKVSKAIILVTHDRYFLNRITNHIVEVDHGHMYTYEGNYGYYLEQREIRYEQARSIEAKRQSFLRKEIEWIRAGAQARSTKQKGRIQRYEAIKAQEAPEVQQSLQLSSASTRLGNKVIEMEHCSKAYDKPLFSDFTYTVGRRDRIGIIGHNGCGKSTLLKILMGQETVDSGNVTIGDTVKTGYFAQHNEVFDDTQRRIDFIKDFGEVVYTAEGDPVTASQMLERFLFAKEEQYMPVGKCSGGEKRRLYLCSVLMSAPNVLLMDEPTNDLDTDTLMILEDYLDSFEGTVIVVSHDRYFLDKTCDTLWVFKDGKIEVRSESYSDYLLTVKKEESVKEEKKKPVQVKPVTRRLSYMENKEKEQIEEVLPLLEQQIKDLEEKLSSVTEYDAIKEISDTLEQKRNELETKSERWMELEEIAQG
ncbi:MAG: ABC-F family ATP-binding cassette domain-containing protein [Bulleidia sp.]|nr:ABC-F family ATP-binding cassette domain-containing protein [Bulleidia sp.]